MKRKRVEDLPPAVVDGALVRLVTDGVMTSVEQWMGPERGWEATSFLPLSEDKGEEAPPAPARPPKTPRLHAVEKGGA